MRNQTDQQKVDDGLTPFWATIIETLKQKRIYLFEEKCIGSMYAASTKAMKWKLHQSQKNSAEKLKTTQKARHQLERQKISMYRNKKQNKINKRYIEYSKT